MDNKTLMQQSHQGAQGDNLLSLASHELRTPMSIIKWYTEMLLDGDAGSLTEDQTKYLRTIQTSNQRAIDLIRSLLNVSRLDLGTFSVSPVDTDLRFIVKQVLAEYKALIEEKKIHVEEKYEGAVPGIISNVCVDPQIALVMIRSFISNALLFSKEEGVVHLEINEMKKGDVYIGHTLQDDSFVVSVSDSGIGIPKGDISSISTRFFKASNATDKDSKGAGLSLYIVNRILEKTGGETWFTSEENVGSTFCVTFPKSGMPKKEGRTTLD